MELIIKQEDLLSQLKRTKINFKESPKERLTEQHLEARIKIVEQKWEQFNKTHDQILDKIEELRATSYFANGVYEETEEFYIEFIAELKEFHQKLLKNTLESLEKAENEISSATVKLPKITIPSFSGSYTEWMSFRDMFMSLIHNNKSLNDVQKLHYLKSHLSGEAEVLLRHIPVTKDNYEQSWNLLVKRYNKKYYLVNYILKRFFSLPNLMNESSFAIKKLLYVTMDTLNALKKLDIDVKSWDVIIIYIVSLKLDHESRKLWGMEVSKSVTNSEYLPNLDQFYEFLQNRYHSLEFMDLKLSGSFNANTSTATPFVGFKPNIGTSACGVPSAFGASTFAQPASSTTSFGGFKSTTGTSVFGAPLAFGASTSAQSATGGGLFGAAQPSTSLFGNTSASTSASPFGASVSRFGIGSSSMSTGLFGQPNTSGGLFPNTQDTSAFGAKPSDESDNNAEQLGPPRERKKTGLQGQLEEADIPVEDDRRSGEAVSAAAGRRGASDDVTQG